eukprot:CAMPEP_0172180098 /NCGR_PEP_ID=MMETSP1050-20130122/17009_1 /TAXON_ID=233186 /ORGANISM="Cryptomonas curvata, Strain CCAP979/52" /LENGTH=1103 /DNA_ID=CAMNT_0012853103 /DNA_START=233 /DNA_END=3544 /DNA_ORIENTATION=+
MCSATGSTNDLSSGVGRPASPRAKSPSVARASKGATTLERAGSRHGSITSINGLGSGTATPVSRLSRPSSREQILHEYHFSRRPGDKNEILLDAQGKAKTRVEFQVQVKTELGDSVYVTGSIVELGCWDHRNGLQLSTNASIYPMWTGSHMIPSGQWVKYKYVVLQADGNVRWEGIPDRMFTPEGMNIMLEDGHFDVERARLLNKNLVSVGGGDVGARKGKGKMAGLDCLHSTAKIEAADTIYIMTYRLPLVTTRSPETGRLEFKWLSFLSDEKMRGMDSTGAQQDRVMRCMSRHGLYVIENLRELRSRCKVWYVGGLGIEVDPSEQEALTEELGAKFNCIPVFLPAGIAAEFEDFCHEVLKPVFHFVHPTSHDVAVSFSRHPPPASSNPAAAATGSKWQLYNTVNVEYVKPVVDNFNDGDCVLVFDLELMLTPTLIGSRARTANICFLFNTPFPSTEIFRTLPVRKEILRSLLNADCIQFHCYTYARHFLSSCSTLLGLEHKPARGGMLHLVFNGHHVHVRASHVGIDADTLAVRLREDRVVQEQAAWRARFEGLGKSVVLVGYDDMEPLSGLTLKLKALQSMLALFPEYRHHTLLVQVAIPLYDSRGELMHMHYMEEVQTLAASINKVYPDSVLLLQEKLPFAPRCALFSASDALVNSAVRHGLSLVPFEYVLATEVGRSKGQLVLSEFAPCSRVIPGIMRTNPWRDEDLARAIVKCLRQPAHERAHLHGQQLAWCRHNTVLRWVETILVDMKMLRDMMRDMGEDVKRGASCRVGLVKATHKEMSSNTLKPGQVHAAYSTCKVRLILVDVDLMIRPKEEMGDASKHHLIRALEQLVEERGNYVFLLSSETADNLLKWLGTMRCLNQVGLGAEDGYKYKWPGSPPDRWDVRHEVRADWKEVALSVMQGYTVRTTGTFVEEEKVASLTWHYGSTNPEFAAMQGKELLNHLNDTLAHLPVEVLMGKSCVRVRHEGVTKGALVEHILDHYAKRGGADFILCLGDDRMDERMFAILRDYHQAAQYRVVEHAQHEVKVFPVTVGRQPSLATYCLYTLDEVHELLLGLSVQTKRRLRSAATMLELNSVRHSPARPESWAPAPSPGPVY